MTSFLIKDIEDQDLSAVDRYEENEYEMGVSINNSLETINDNGGFNVVAWGKRGEKVDSNDSSKKVLSDDFNLHVVSIIPTKESINIPKYSLPVDDIDLL